MGTFPHRKPPPRQHQDRRAGRASEALKRAYARPLASEPEPRQKPTGWTLARRRAVQTERLKQVPRVAVAALAIAVLAIVGFGIRDMARPRALMPLAENREAFDALADFGTRGEAPGQTDVPAPEATRLARDLRVYRIARTREGTVVLSPRSGLLVQYARYPNGEWDVGKLPFSDPN